MDISIKQKEIEEAIEGYISKQGINLANKKVTMAFTAGRKQSGISADISISDDIELSNVPTPRAQLADLLIEKISEPVNVDEIPSADPGIADTEEPVVGNKSIFNQ